MSMLFLVRLLFTLCRSMHWLLFGLGFALLLILQVSFNTSVIR